MEYVGIVFYVAFIALMIASMWKIFDKAGKPGWASIVPIYNAIVFLEICERPVWWIVLLLIPCVGAIVAIILYSDLATKFGKGGGFAVGLILLGFIFFPILAFGDAQYQPSGRGRPRRRDDDLDDYDDRPRRRRDED